MKRAVPPALGPSALGFLTLHRAARRWTHTVRPRGGRRRRPRGGAGPTTRISARSRLTGDRAPFHFISFRNRTVTRIHNGSINARHYSAQPTPVTTPPRTTPDFGARADIPVVPRDPTASPGVRSLPRDTHGGRPDPGARSRACQRNRANGTCATSGPCQAPRHQAPTCLRKLLQRVYMYTEYRPSRQAEPADEGPAHGPMGTRTQASRLELAIRHLAAILLIEYQAADLSALATA